MGVGCEEDVIRFLLRGLEQLAVLQRRPTTLVSGRHLVLWAQFPPERYRDTLIEQDSHLDGHGAAGSMVEDHANLLARHAREPLDELRRRGPVL